MKSKKIRQFIGLISMAVLVFTWAHLAEATEIKFLKVIYGKAQERMGAEIKGLSWLEFNRGRVQEELGRFIQEGGPEMKISQEALGSGIAAAAHIKWQTRGANVLLAKAIVKSATIVAREESILGPDAIQGRLGAMILARAQKELVHRSEAGVDDIYNAARHQEALGAQIARTARLSWASGEMSKAVFATTQGRITPEISGEVIRTVQSAGGFGHTEDFRLGLSVLASEGGSAFTELMPSEVTSAPTRAATYAGVGWGGFAEYGFASVAGFIFAMWLFSNSVTSLEPPVEKGEEEELYEYLEAA